MLIALSRERLPGGADGSAGLIPYIPMASVSVSTASVTFFAALWATRRISRREGAIVMPIMEPAAIPMVIPKKNLPVPHPFMAASLPFPRQLQLLWRALLFFPFPGKNALLNLVDSAII